LTIDATYAAGLGDIQPGERIVVLFHFHRSAPFEPGLLRQRPPHRDADVGVFSICSPRRPNPIGLSVLEVTAINENRIRVRGIDMFDGTPILDIKPLVTAAAECPSTDRRDDP
jgi:tRNA-Thr(GGU) m(6)t(6)A37 methyltransferase TsaA